MPVLRTTVSRNAEFQYAKLRRQFRASLGLLLGVTGATAFGLYLLSPHRTEDREAALFDSLWNAVNAITTLGDFTDFTRAQQLFMIGAMLASVTIASYAITSLIGIMTGPDIALLRESRRMERTIGDLSGHVIVVGFGAMGQQAAAAFRTAGRVVVVIDRIEAAANEAAAAGFHAIQGDAALDTTQKAARIDRAEALVISILAGADKLSIVLIARALHPTLHIETLASSEHASEWLRHAGADIVIRSEELVAREFVQALSVRQGARQGSPAGRTSPPR